MSDAAINTGDAKILNLWRAYWTIIKIYVVVVTVGLMSFVVYRIVEALVWK